MPRLRNKRTGTTVNVDDVTASQLQSGSDNWAPVDQGEPKKAPAKKAASSKSNN